MPKRIKIDWRVKGGKKPADVVVVARPAKWGNRFKVGDPGVPDAAAAVRLFCENLTPYRHHGPAVNGSKLADYLIAEAILKDLQRDLRGRDLACYCDLDQPCHADVLLDLANMPSVE